MISKKNKILVFGTFDVLHKGHLNFFLQARKLVKNPFLIVSVARDVNVKKIKGHKPFFGEKYRLANVRKNKLVNRVVLGAPRNYLKHILAIKPQIIALGYDQAAYTKGLHAKLLGLRLDVKIVRLKAYHPLLYKSSLMKK